MSSKLLETECGRLEKATALGYQVVTGLAGSSEGKSCQTVRFLQTDLQSPCFESFRPSKETWEEIAMDASSLIVRDKHQSLSRSTSTKLEVVNAFRRRVLAFDLVKLAAYDKIGRAHV